LKKLTFSKKSMFSFTRKMNSNQLKLIHLEQIHG
jgi:hypothetical protein